MAPWGPQLYFRISRSLGALLLFPLLAGLGEAPPIMKDAVPIQAGPDQALVTFISASGGRASFDPLARNQVIQVWDGLDFLGFLAAGQLLQYPTNAGEHIFVLYGRSVGGIKAHLQAGKSYYVGIERGLIIRPGLELIKPDDARIGGWLKELQPVVLDPGLWAQQKQVCNWPHYRPDISAKLCRVMEYEHAKAINMVRNEHCELRPLDSLKVNCKYLAIEPDDGR